MKVVLLSEIDYAASAFKLYEALKRHTDIDIQLFSGKPQNKLNHPTNIIVTKNNLSKVQQEVNSADILHFKGDWPPKDGYLGLKIPKNKPIVLTTSGSFFRKKEFGGIGKYSNSDYTNVTLKTSFETDLLYPEYSDIWTPHPIDSENKRNIWDVERPVFMHIPSDVNRKGTDFVDKVFKILDKKLLCDTMILTKISYKDSLRYKEQSTIYFDQFKVGFYGNSALEAMQWGIPVVCWISPMAIEQAKGKLDKCPIINQDMSDPLKTAETVIEALSNHETLSVLTKRWCDSVHSYKAVANQWEELYHGLL